MIGSSVYVYVFGFTGKVLKTEFISGKSPAACKYSNKFRYIL